jgi:hypothetical protein
MESAEHSMWLVAGTGCVEEMVSYRLQLPEPALEVLEWRKAVVVTQAEAVRGGAILTGFVRSRCIFAAPDRMERGSGDCTARGALLQQASGRVLFHWADLGFTLHVPVPAALPGMQVTVTDAFVTGDASSPLETDAAGLIHSLVDQSTLVVRLRVLQAAFAPARSGGRRRKTDARRKAGTRRKTRARGKAKVAAKARKQAPVPAKAPKQPVAALKADQAFRAMDIHTWVAASAMLASSETC